MLKEWLDSIRMKTSKKLRFNNTSQIIKGKVICFFLVVVEKRYWYFVLSELLRCPAMA